MTKFLAKPLSVLFAFGIFAMTFQSCQREGCPGQITKVADTQVEQSC